MESILETLDLSNTKLKRLNKPSPAESQVVNLILDDNELTRLDNIDSFTKVQKFSAVRNQLLRMYGVCRLHLLQILNLSYNGILTIEGLKELVNLKWLCLAGNSIKTIEHLQTNTELEYLDLSENNVTHITDLSFLKNLKELYLHKNKINHLDQCDRFLPVSLKTLTLACNNIGDLNEVSRLVNLVHLTKISIANNPCVNMTGNNVGFDYRPFIVNWLLNVNVIDEYVVDAIESLRAEWLYSQGRGRHYRVGDQMELVQYLASVCPLTGETLETEDDRKLRVILSKAKHHQQQLREQSSTGVTPVPSPISKKKIIGSRQSPRLNASSKMKPKSPDRMASSCYGTLSDLSSASMMSQSLDPTILRQTVTPRLSNEYIIQEKYFDSDSIKSPLQALSKNVPVPESLMSPDYHPAIAMGKQTPTVVTTLTMTSTTPVGSPRPQHNATFGPPAVKASKPSNNSRAGSAKTRARGTTKQSDVLRKTGSPSPGRHKTAGNVATTNWVESTKKPPPSIMRNNNCSASSDEESEMCDSKLRTIQLKAKERSGAGAQKAEEATSNGSNDDNNKVEEAAVCIQRIWRGFYTRNRDVAVRSRFKELEGQRANQYIQKLATDMETTKAALESERKIQMLQTEAISALWKKISNIQPSESEAPSTNKTNLNASSTTTPSFNNGQVVKELAQTCTMLQSQIQQLQTSMQDIVNVMSVFGQSVGIYRQSKDGTGTQTEIVAVHTPKGEAAKVFPFQRATVAPPQSQSRPSSLPLPVHQRRKDNGSQDVAGGVAVTSELSQFAVTLVDGVIKTVSESRVGNPETGDSGHVVDGKLAKEENVNLVQDENV